MIVYAEQRFKIRRRKRPPELVLRLAYDGLKAAVLIRAAHDILRGVLGKLVGRGEHGLLRRMRRLRRRVRKRQAAELFVSVFDLRSRAA